MRCKHSTHHFQFPCPFCEDEVTNAPRSVTEPIIQRNFEQTIEQEAAMWFDNWKFSQEKIQQLESEFAELKAKLVMAQDAIETRKAADKYCQQYRHLGDEAEENCADAQQQADELMEKFLNATSADVQRYRDEIKAEGLEETARSNHFCFRRDSDTRETLLLLASKS